MLSPIPPPSRTLDRLHELNGSSQPSAIAPTTHQARPRTHRRATTQTAPSIQPTIRTEQTDPPTVVPEQARVWGSRLQGRYNISQPLKGLIDLTTTSAPLLDWISGGTSDVLLLDAFDGTWPHQQPTPEKQTLRHLEPQQPCNNQQPLQHLAEATVVHDTSSDSQQESAAHSSSGSSSTLQIVDDANKFAGKQTTKQRRKQPPNYAVGDQTGAVHISAEKSTSKPPQGANTVGTGRMQTDAMTDVPAMSLNNITDNPVGDRLSTPAPTASKLLSSRISDATSIAQLRQLLLPCHSTENLLQQSQQSGACVVPQLNDIHLSALCCRLAELVNRRTNHNDDAQSTAGGHLSEQLPIGIPAGNARQSSNSRKAAQQLLDDLIQHGGYQVVVSSRPSPAAGMLWGLARCDCTLPPTLLQSLIQAVMRGVEDVAINTSQDNNVLTAGHKKGKLKPKNATSKVPSSTNAHSSTSLTPQGFSNTVWACGKLCPHLLSQALPQLAQPLAVSLRHMTSSQVAAVVWGISCQTRHPGSVFTEALAEELWSRKAGSYSVRDVSTLLTAFIRWQQTVQPAVHSDNQPSDGARRLKTPEKQKHHLVSQTVQETLVKRLTTSAYSSRNRRDVVHVARCAIWLLLAYYKNKGKDEAHNSESLTQLLPLISQGVHGLSLKEVSAALWALHFMRNSTAAQTVSSMQGDANQVVALETPTQSTWSDYLWQGRVDALLSRSDTILKQSLATQLQQHSHAASQQIELDVNGQSVTLTCLALQKLELGSKISPTLSQLLATTLERLITDGGLQLQDIAVILSASTHAGGLQLPCQLIYRLLEACKTLMQEDVNIQQGTQNSVDAKGLCTGLIASQRLLIAGQLYAATARLKISGQIQHANNSINNPIICFGQTLQQYIAPAIAYIRDWDQRTSDTHLRTESPTQLMPVTSALATPHGSKPSSTLQPTSERVQTAAAQILWASGQLATIFSLPEASALLSLSLGLRSSDVDSQGGIETNRKPTTRVDIACCYMILEGINKHGKLYRERKQWLQYIWPSVHSIPALTRSGPSLAAATLHSLAALLAPPAGLPGTAKTLSLTSHDQAGSNFVMRGLYKRLGIPRDPVVFVKPFLSKRFFRNLPIATRRLLPDCTDVRQLSLLLLAHIRLGVLPGVQWIKEFVSAVQNHLNLEFLATDLHSSSDVESTNKPVPLSDIASGSENAMKIEDLIFLGDVLLAMRLKVHRSRLSVVKLRKSLVEQRLQLINNNGSTNIEQPVMMDSQANSTTAGVQANEQHDSASNVHASSNSNQAVKYTFSVPSSFANEQGMFQGLKPRPPLPISAVSRSGSSRVDAIQHTNTLMPDSASSPTFSVNMTFQASPNVTRELMPFQKVASPIARATKKSRNLQELSAVSGQLSMTVSQLLNCYASGSDPAVEISASQKKRIKRLAKYLRSKKW